MTAILEPPATEAPEFAAPRAPVLPSQNPIAAFRHHLRLAETLDAQLAAFPALLDERNKIRAAIEEEEDENVMEKLAADLTRQEVTIRTAEIRHRRLARESAEQWEKLQPLANRARDWMEAELEREFGNAYDEALELVEALIDPMAWESYQVESHQRPVLNNAVAVVAGHTLGGFSKAQILLGFNPSSPIILPAFDPLSVDVAQKQNMRNVAAFLDRFDAMLPQVREKQALLAKA